MTGQMPPRAKPATIIVSVTCSTCKHDDTQAHQEPCNTCGRGDKGSFTNWEPAKPEYVARGEVKKPEPKADDRKAKPATIIVSVACSTCKNYGKTLIDAPCRTCGLSDEGSFTNWEPAKPEYVARGEFKKPAIAGHVEKVDVTPSGGAMLRGKNYYQVPVPEPMNPDLKPYVAECADIIEALGMTFNEGEAFKALWRGAAARTLGIVKNTAQYDADKAAHYGQRVAAQVRRGNPAKE